MKKATAILYFLGLALLHANAQKNTGYTVMRQLIAENISLAVKQVALLAHNTPDSLMPRSFDATTNKVLCSNTEWWCSGFFPGTLWYLYEYTKDPAIKQEAEKRLGILKKEQYYTGNHDLGFMMFCSFGNAYRITGNPAYKAVILQSAASLATRYRPSIKAIQSWGSSPSFACPVIIDNMMNLELLEWVSANGGDDRFAAIAATHANTTLKNHFRPDHSSYHVVDYDLQTGMVIRKKTAQGAADSSAWARGQAWGLYGYTMMYRFTHNKAYLQQAKQIAAFLLNHPNLPADKVPFWDFNAPDIPHAFRDASAAAIMASALLELGRYVSAKEKTAMLQVASTLLQTLSTDNYRSKPGENGGFILKHSVGSLPGKSEVDVPLSYADYYFIEALLRYKKWYLDN